MSESENLEKRFLELIRMPVKSKEEVAEVEKIGNKLHSIRAKEMSDLIKELREVGLRHNDIWEMVNTNESYPNAIPILIRHLPKDYHYKNKEGIVRALCVKEAIGKAQVLIEEYNKAPKEMSQYRWAIGNTVHTIITSNDVDKVLEIVMDKSNGVSRHMFILALSKVPSEHVEDVLVELLADGEVLEYALEALTKIKSRKAKDQISKLLTHSNASIRKSAKNALKKIG